MPQDYAKIIGSLKKHEVEFVVIGGTAAVAQGVPIATFDFDIAYRRSKENCHRLADALKIFHPRLRGASEGLPFKWDAETIHKGSNFTLDTDEGQIDLLGHITGTGGYEEIARGAETFQLYGHDVLVMSLEDLARAKKATGRAKDKFHLIEIEATLRLRKKKPSA